MYKIKQTGERVTRKRRRKKKKKKKKQDENTVDTTKQKRRRWNMKQTRRTYRLSKMYACDNELKSKKKQARLRWQTWNVRKEHLMRAFCFIRIQCERSFASCCYQKAPSMYIAQYIIILYAFWRNTNFSYCCGVWWLVALTNIALHRMWIKPLINRSPLMRKWIPQFRSFCLHFSSAAIYRSMVLSRIDKHTTTRQ